MHDENLGVLGQHGVVTNVEYVQNTTHEPLYTGYIYTIVKCTPQGQINGGLVQVCGVDYLRDTGKSFYDTKIPWDDDIPF